MGGAPPRDATVPLPSHIPLAFLSAVFVIALVLKDDGHLFVDRRGFHLRHNVELRPR